VIRRALISVYDKRGLEPFARGLAGLGVELVASGGTAAFLEKVGLPVTPVEELTEVPELLGGRVKTLHPRIHAAILARRDRADDSAALDEHGIEPFDLVCVNLYPFEDVVSRRAVGERDAVEMIDIGGPAMLRAAAKNFAHVAPVCRPERYDEVLLELQADNDLTLDSRRRLAAETFGLTAAYEAAIAGWFSALEAFPPVFLPGFTRELELAYGENPHQNAAYYAERGARMHLLSRVEQLHGPNLSFNNLYDLSAARLITREFELPACVIVKHANPCGVALAGSIEQAYERALGGDPISAYGGVIVLNRPVSEALGEKLSEHFMHVLFAPGYDDAALARLREKPAARILEDRERRLSNPGERDYRRVLGGLLVQERDSEIDDRDTMEVVCGSPSEMAWGDLLFAWRVCKHVTSNGIVLAHDLQTIGIGAGQMSRVDAVRIALEKAREHGHQTAGAVMASDAFFPFADGPQLALAAGVTGVIQPGGSKRDAEVIEAVERAGATLVLTHRRHFRH
jgi:phosphoribosylaminoimidazolecarboxamide formyltransferase / IMP cyclohydrolase